MNDYKACQAADGSGAATSIPSTAILLQIAAGFSGTTHESSLVFVSGGPPGDVSSRLPGSIRPGFYLLRVSAGGHADQGAVRVLRRS